MFETLHREAERGVADGQGYANALKFSLLRREGAGVLPRDDEFRRCFEWRDFYHIDRKRLYPYDRLENGDSVERVNVVGMLEDGTLTVEHIMPQTLSPQWRHELGEEADDEVHAAYVNTIGNLTLTGYNSQYSNNPFADKRDRENGFRDSGLRLSRAVALCDRWGIREIEERRERLWSRFLKLWPMPESTYAPAEVARESRALDGGFEFTGLKVSACSPAWRAGRRGHVGGGHALAAAPGLRRGPPRVQGRGDGREVPVGVLLDRALGLWLRDRRRHLVQPRVLDVGEDGDAAPDRRQGRHVGAGRHLL